MTLQPPPESADYWSRHSVYSDPGRHRVLVRALPDDLGSLCAAARNVIGHYRAELPDLPAIRHHEIDSRWLESILDLDQERHPHPLDRPRPLTDRVAGCCRDHSLFVVGALRERGVAARTRVGFADYLVPGCLIDHVVVEYHDGTRWRRVDPEVAPGDVDVDLDTDPTGSAAPFRVAAHVWQALRRGDVDRDRVVVPVAAMTVAEFVRTYVVHDVAHRHGDELLLWDHWDVMDRATDDDTDALAATILRADAGGRTAERRLVARYHRLRAPAIVTRYSPFGRPPVPVRLR